jgi:hypothetical protein
MVPAHAAKPLLPLRTPRIVVQGAMPSRHTLQPHGVPEPFGARLTVALPRRAAGQWCRFRLGLPEGGPWWAKLHLTDEARGQIVREVFLGAMRSRDGMAWRETLVHVPFHARALEVLVFGAAPSGASLGLSILRRGAAATALLRAGWRGVPAALAGSPLGALGRLRAMIGQAPARAGEVPSYPAWISLFEAPCDPLALAQAEAWDVQIAVVAGAAGATQASLTAATRLLPHAGRVVAVAGDADWARISAEWAILVQAGEVLSPHALAAFAAAARACPWAEMLTADCDRLTPQGTRDAPLFKPGPDHVLLASGLPLHGACAIRWRNIPAALPLHAHAARAVLAGRAPHAIAHVPQICSHIRPDYRPPDASPQLATARVAAAGPATPGVTMLVPSAARGRHVLRCLRRVVRVTDYPAFHVKLVLSQPARARKHILRAVARLPQVTIEAADATAPAPGAKSSGRGEHAGNTPLNHARPFNYARVNNRAAASVTSDLILLLNDDVAPIGRDWLRAMVAHMADPEIGIVGARLLYGNGQVQHEGVIMGLANLCEHAGRLRAGADPGPHGIGLLDRQVSAVTGACLLIRTSLYAALGGMDPAYAIALNDVDLCLRAREAGWRVVFCASATLHHYESLSLGRHYAGGRAALESIEVRRLRGRFGAVIAADPFYNPNAALQPGREWQPAFPPRGAGPAPGTVPQPAKPCGLS